MMLLGDDQMSVALHVIDPESKFTDEGSTTSALVGGAPITGEGDDGGQTALVPNLYMVRSIGNDVEVLYLADGPAYDFENLDDPERLNLALDHYRRLLQAYRLIHQENPNLHQHFSLYQGFSDGTEYGPIGGALPVEEGSKYGYHAQDEIFNQFRRGLNLGNPISDI